jgi:hypothetical protein
LTGFGRTLRGAEDICPLRAYRARLAKSGITEGPVFRPITRHGKMEIAALSRPAVALIVKRDRFGTEHTSRVSVSRVSFAEDKMHAFLKRFLMHYGIYRRYPLGRLPALRNAWRTAQP